MENLIYGPGKMKIKYLETKLDDDGLFVCISRKPPYLLSEFESAWC